MNPNSFRNAVILTGPTGSGKSALGLKLAERLGAEIVSMDSMALYRGMDIGTAKPTPDERRRVRHHLLDVLDPWEFASVAWWLEQAAACCRDIEARGKRILFVGGTALYLKTLLFGLFDGPPADEALRRDLETKAHEKGPQALHARLARIDPATAARLHPNDVRRVIRALEVWNLTGRPISAWQTQWREKGRGGEGEKGRVETSRPADAAPLPFSPSPLLPFSPSLIPPRAFWLDRPRPELYSRIDARVRHMFDAGLIEEAEALRRLPYPLSKEAGQALGYREAFAYLDGLASLEETVGQVQTRSRNFAKRQLTWFRHLPGCLAMSGELTEADWERTMELRMEN